MLGYEFRRDDGILVLTPEGALEASDFANLTSQVDAYIEQNGNLRGVLIRAKAFPGWKDFGALIAHLKFVKRHHQLIEKVAVVADGAAATVLPSIGSHFVAAEVKHFRHDDDKAAWDWLVHRASPEGNER